MLRSTVDIPPECRECFAVNEAINKLAVLQEEFTKQPEIVSAEEAALGLAGRISKARQSKDGALYTEAEDNMLDILELATFCSGGKEDCFRNQVQKS